MSILERIPNTHALGPDTRAMLERISKSCKACQLNGKPPERFRFVLHDQSRFNHEILVDIMKLDNGNVLHVMCAQTRYQQGLFLQSMTARACWDSILMCWTNVLAGSPDIIKADAGLQFNSKEFKDFAKSSGVVVEIVPKEAHHKIGLLERYHKVVRNVYNKLKADEPSMDKHLRLSTTFRCVNDSVGPDGIVPTLLVFGSYPKLGLIQSAPAPTTMERANAIRKATKLATEMFNEERVRTAAKNGPSANVVLIDKVKRLEAQAPVLVWQEKKGWTGPLSFVAADDHGAWVLNENGNEIRVSLHVVKPYVPETWTLFSKLKNPIFAQSRAQELDVLFSRKVVKVVDASDAYGHRVYHGSWVENQKSDGTPKSRMIICATHDYLETLTYSPTVKRLSTRVGFSYAACRPEFTVSFRDVKTAFLQSDTVLRRHIYLELPHELREGNKGKVIKVLKPMYGLPESPLNWYATYLSHYKSELGMICAAHDPCMLMIPPAKEMSCDGVVLLQVDDTTTLGTKLFHEEEEEASKRFDNHGAKFLSETPITHNGADISFQNGCYVMSQSKSIGRLQIIPKDLDDDQAFKMFRSQRAVAMYPATLTRPDLLGRTSRFTQITRENFTSRVRIRFNRFVNETLMTKDIPLRFVPLDSKTAHVVVFTDASFYSMDEIRSQLGIVVLLRDGHGNSNLVHASSVRARRRARSVLSAEIFALMDGFDAGYVVRDLLSKLLGRKVDLHILTDSRSAFHILTTLITTKEKRLMLDVHLMREAYERREITRVSWISSSCNISDCLTKVNHNGSLLSFVKTNRAKITCEGWIDRDLPPVHVEEVSVNEANEMKQNAIANLKSTEQR